MAHTAGLPGLTGVDHIGFTVPNLEEARAFLVNVLGCEFVLITGTHEPTPQVINVG